MPPRIRRRSSAWIALAPGVRRRADDQGLAATLRAWAEKLPAETRFTHLTACAAHRLWLPPLPPDPPVFVALPAARGPVQRSQVVTHRLSTAPGTVLIDGVRVVTVPRLCWPAHATCISSTWSC